MLGINYLPLFFIATLPLVLMPGAATQLVAGSVRKPVGRRAATALGIVAGHVVLIALAGLALAALEANWPILLQMIEVFGGLAILYLGLVQYNSPPCGTAPAASSVAPAGFKAALRTTLANPAPALLFAAVFPLFMATEPQGEMRTFYALGAMFEVANLVYLAALTVVLAQAHVHVLPQRVFGVAMHKLNGVGLILCAALILVA